MKYGFDNDKYISIQSQHIKERIAQFSGKLYLEAKDYEIVGYIANRSKGTGKVVIRGTGDYSGVKEVTFKIQQKAFTGNAR